MSEKQQEIDYIALQRLMANLVQSKAGQSIGPGQEWLNDAQALARKLFEHLASLHALTVPHRIDIDGHSSFAFVDHSSVKVIARAAFETYLVFSFIFSGQDRSLSEFRHKIWRYGGLGDRQKLHPISDDARALQAREKAEMQRLKTEIEASSHLDVYPREAVKRILKGEWRGNDSWAALGRYAGLHENYFRDVYGYLCSYSHTSYLSVLQVGQAQLLEEQRGLANMCIGIGLVLMARFAHTYIGLFTDTAIILDVDGAAKQAVKRWAFTADDWEALISKQKKAAP